jgi:hypothetical protein
MKEASFEKLLLVTWIRCLRMSKPLRLELRIFLLYELMQFVKFCTRISKICGNVNAGILIDTEFSFWIIAPFSPNWGFGDGKSTYRMSQIGRFSQKCQKCQNHCTFLYSDDQDFLTNFQIVSTTIWWARGFAPPLIPDDPAHRLRKIPKHLFASLEKLLQDVFSGTVCSSAPSRRRTSIAWG